LQIIESEFGMVAFQTGADYQNVTGIMRRMCAYLTEDQAILIGTLSRNTDQVLSLLNLSARRERL